MYNVIDCCHKTYSEKTFDSGFSSLRSRSKDSEDLMIGQSRLLEVGQYLMRDKVNDKRQKQKKLNSKQGDLSSRGRRTKCYRIKPIKFTAADDSVQMEKNKILFLLDKEYYVPFNSSSKYDVSPNYRNSYISKSFRVC